MPTEDLIELPASINLGRESENGELHDFNCVPVDPDSQPSKSEVEEDNTCRDITGTAKVDAGIGDSQVLVASEVDVNLIESSSVLQVRVELSETVAVAEDMDCFSTRIQTENGCISGQEGSPSSRQKREGSPVSDSMPGVKKARLTVDERQPSVHVMFNHLTRGSKRKLEELLKHWSEWHAKHYSSSRVPNEVLESGEETYFPALRVGSDNPSAVSFWIDNQPRNQQDKELDAMSIPQYDRGYSLEGCMEIGDASRCFNCGSYSHALKDCPKPRDNAVVNNARKQHKSKRNQNASSCNPTRYYQSSRGGKYDGLRPGVLDAETRKLLGLGELDPPPWLNRMRDLGYPPGYLDPENEDQPSGIIIFGDEESDIRETEDGEILEASNPDPPRKMSVEFPGVNAPIPANADERQWAAGRTSFDLSRNRSYRRFNSSSETFSSRGQHHEQRWSRDFRDEEAPPGCDPGFSPTLSNFSPRYHGYESSFSSQITRGDNLTPRSTSYGPFGRSLSDRGRWSPSSYEGSYSSLQYLPSDRYQH